MARAEREQKNQGSEKPLAPRKQRHVAALAIVVRAVLLVVQPQRALLVVEDYLPEAALTYRSGNK